MHCPDLRRKIHVCWPSSTFVSTVTTHESKTSLKSEYIRKIASDTCLICSMPTPTSLKTPPGLIKSNECVPCTYTTSSGYNDVKLYPYSEYRLCDCAFKLRHSRQRTHTNGFDPRRHTSDKLSTNHTSGGCRNYSAQSNSTPYTLSNSYKSANKMRLVTSNQNQTTTIFRLPTFESCLHNQLPESYNRHSHYCNDPHNQQKCNPNSVEPQRQDFMRHSYPSADYYPHNNIELVPNSRQQVDSSKLSVILLADHGKLEVVAKPRIASTRHQVRSQPLQQCSVSSKSFLRKMVCTNLSTPSAPPDTRQLEDYVALFKEVQIH